MTRTACGGRCFPKLLDCSPNPNSATSPMNVPQIHQRRLRQARTAMTFRLGKWVKFMNAEPTL